ncbi:MAG TPA: hypothetical protein VEZ90_11985 [Blastocatellia bacterium]|nr:hypothetical protein [Blastocatellia bacterium]
MFIPRSIPLHENLSTSYVLVDALVDDLCEGGFSGVVEVVLRQTDCGVVVSKGKVIAAVENQPTTPKKMSVGELAQRARAERGHISVYSCSNETALALAGRMFSESLYNRLSTEFADLDKMISKLGREKEREWFVDIETGGGLTGLVHIRDHQFRAVTSSAEAAEGTRALQKLLEECKKTGATFDVYYRPANEPLDAVTEAAPKSAIEGIDTAVEAEAFSKVEEPLPPSIVAAQTVARIEAPERAAPPQAFAQSQPNGQSQLIAQAHDTAVSEPKGLQTPVLQPQIQQTAETAVPQAKGRFADAANAQLESRTVETAEPESAAEVLREVRVEPIEQGSKAAAAVASASDNDFVVSEIEAVEPEVIAETQFAPVDEIDLEIPSGLQPDAQPPASPEQVEPTIPAVKPRVPATRLLAADELAMFEVRRLMAEIASTIENAARVIEPRDTFSIYLRAGQLKIADRYPFLDPFGNEFEYIAGEIVFVGEETPEVFVEGLTEALRLAVISIVEASAQPANLRSRIEDELYALLEKERAPLQRLKLDTAIEKIIG